MNEQKRNLPRSFPLQVWLIIREAAWYTLPAIWEKYRKWGTGGVVILSHLPKTVRVWQCLTLKKEFGTVSSEHGLVKPSLSLCQPRIKSNDVKVLDRPILGCQKSRVSIFFMRSHKAFDIWDDSGLKSKHALSFTWAWLCRFRFRVTFNKGPSWKSRQSLKRSMKPRVDLFDVWGEAYCDRKYINHSRNLLVAI